MLQFFKGVSTIPIYVQRAFGNTAGKHPQSVFSGVIDAQIRTAIKEKRLAELKKEWFPKA
jgi:hypothetical protein